MDRSINRSKRSKSKKINKLTYRMQVNFIFVFFVIILVFAGLIARMVYISHEKGEKYEQRALSQQSFVSSIISYKRGTIMDRNGIALAKSDKYYNVIFDPKVLLSSQYSIDVTLDALCEVFELKRNELEDILLEKPSSSYEILLKNVEYQKVEKFDIKVQKAKEADRLKRIIGVTFEESYVRSYPYESLASNVVGWANSANEGLFGGLEQYYNSELNGTNGRIYGYYDAELNITRTEKKALNGNNLITTIDVNIQSIVERYIKEFNDKTGCDNIGIILMNPNNGEIYAMASNNGYDLNNPFDLSSNYTEAEKAKMTNEEKTNAAQMMWKNFCISDSFEPGSTFKPFTVAAALEEDSVKASDTFVCFGKLHIGGWDITCNNKGGHGTLTLAQALTKSCNPALMAINEKLGRDYFYQYQLNFGFGNKTGIDLPGENAGLLNLPGKLNVTELATSSFGQGFTVNMVQIISAFSSLINGGFYYNPHIVKEIVNENGAVIYEADTEPVKVTVSQSTSEFMREAMYLTVEDGTATPAKVLGYLVGGKTGTAQKKPREDKKWVVSFVGAVPIDAPELVIYIAIDVIHNEEDKNKSSIATKMTSSILEEVLPFISIYPDGDINYRVDLPQISNENNMGGVTEDGTIIPPYNPAEDETSADNIPSGMEN